MLVSHVGVVDTNVLDLYAGSGSFGLECLSRGAAHVTFVEQRRDAVAVIKANLDTLDFGDRATVLQASVLHGDADGDRKPVTHQILSRPFDVAFCDPPYANDPWAPLLEAIKADVLIGHASKDVPLTDDWEELRRRSYGRARIVLARRVSSVPG